MHQDALCAGIHYLIHMIRCYRGFPVNDHLVPFNGNHFAGILIHEILYPGSENPGSQFPPYQLFDTRLGYLMFLGKVKNFQYLLVALESDGTKKGCYRKLLLPVDICKHHIVDVGGKLNP